MAAIDLSASASVTVEHNSNPVELSDREALDFQAVGLSGVSDTSKRLTATATAKTHGVGPLQLNLEGQFSHEEFDRFKRLGHNSYGVTGGADWKPTPLFDISLHAMQNLVPISLAIVGGDQVVQQKTLQVDGALRVRVTPRWQVSASPQWYNTETPLPGRPKFQLRENSGSLSLDFLGARRVTPGVSVAESKGAYSRIVNATRYTQRSVQGTLNYKVTDFSNFSLYVGRSQRSTELIAPSTDPDALALEGNQPAVTGRLTYTRRLTAKTDFTVGAFRDFQQYDVGVNTTVGTGINGTFAWKATPRFAATFETQFVWSTVDDPLALRTGGERKDLTRNFSVGVQYAPRQTLALRTYLTRRMRDSTLGSVLFDGTIAGVELKFTVD
jgi:hypothetical protein